VFEPNVEYTVPQWWSIVNRSLLSETLVITPIQVRMARAALGWGVRDLAKHAGLSANTVSRFENGFGAMVDTLARIQETLETTGIVFIPADEHAGPGIRLRNMPPQSKRKRRR
jgi:transcriptional regulator with XRE-family HTH domain